MKSVKDKLVNYLKNQIIDCIRKQKELTLENFVKCFEEVTQQLKEEITNPVKLRGLYIKWLGLENLDEIKLGEHFKDIETIYDILPEYKEQLDKFKKGVVHEIIRLLNIQEHFGLKSKPEVQDTSSQLRIALNELLLSREKTPPKKHPQHKPGETMVVQTR